MMRTRPSLPDIPRNNVLLDFVAKEMLPGKAKQELGGDLEALDGDTSDFDFSPLTPSDQRIAVGHNQTNEEACLESKGEKGEDLCKQDDEEENVEGYGDVCSLDEGLGGLSDTDIADGSTKETTIIGGGQLSSQENNCGDDVKVDAANTTTDQIAEEAEQSFSLGSEDEGDAPPLPEVEPPRNPVERKPSRIPKKIQNGSPSKNCETIEAEKGSKEAEGRMEKGEGLKDRAFSPERRPSRISFETML